MKQHYVMPVGLDDFRRVREEYYYVDKTDFIRQLIDGHAQATLITRPRRFGKTLSLSMLYYFFTNKDAEANRVLFEGSKAVGLVEVADDDEFGFADGCLYLILVLSVGKDEDRVGSRQPFEEVGEYVRHDDGGLFAFPLEDVLQCERRADGIAVGIDVSADDDRPPVPL